MYPASAPPPRQQRRRCRWSARTTRCARCGRAARRPETPMCVSRAQEVEPAATAADRARARAAAPSAAPRRRGHRRRRSDPTGRPRPRRAELLNFVAPRPRRRAPATSVFLAASARAPRRTPHTRYLLSHSRKCTMGRTRWRTGRTRRRRQRSPLDLFHPALFARCAAAAAARTAQQPSSRPGLGRILGLRMRWMPSRRVLAASTAGSLLAEARRCDRCAARGQSRTVRTQ
mmetsp:Transcript_21941/g.65568  ORF Transcript_21941/g.65568 Transcript_21941/m.65568 type:complete len:231 (-) Transcript_21941:1641-2333(-)